MYRTTGATIEEIVLERRSRPRVPLTAVVALGLVFAALLGILGFADTHVDRAGTFRNAAFAFVALAIVALLVRTPRLVVKRVGRELRIRSGKRESAVLVGEVLEVDVDTEAEHAHRVVLALRDRRRIPVGEPLALMADALADRRTLRAALLR